MSFRRYPTYRASGVEWLEDVPEHWEVKTIRKFGRLKGGAGFPHDFQGIDDAELQFHKVNSLSNADNHGFLQRGENSISRATASSLGAYVFPKDTIVFAKVGAALLLGRIRVLKEEACIDNNMMGLIVDSEFCCVKFIKHVMCVVQFDRIANPGAVPSINESQIGNFSLPLPPLPEQTAIAAFLDRETAKIDTLVAEQRRLIVLLKEKRQAVISHAVTKGLNPDAPMKASGIEWLGDVPAHWEVVPMRRIASIVRGASPRPAGDPKFFGGAFAPWVTVAEITKDETIYLTETESFLTEEGAAQSNLFRSGTLIYSNSGATLGVPKVLKIDACANDGVVAFLDLDARVLTEFLYHYLRSITEHVREKIRQGSGQPNLNTDLVKEFSVGIPPVDEQGQIVKNIWKFTGQFDTLITEAERAIDLLQERRTALISAAVTGQIDVRDVVALSTEIPAVGDWARPTLAAEILSRCYQQNTTGRIKLMKLIYLCEHHAQLAEIDGQYERSAAGPYNETLLTEITDQLRERAWFQELGETKDGYYYRPLPRQGGHREYLSAWSAQLSRIQVIVDWLESKNTRTCEIIATLYAAWNDLLLEGRSPADDEIIAAAVWHPKKEKITDREWQEGLRALREHGVVPTGFGRHTGPIRSTRLAQT